MDLNNVLLKHNHDWVNWFSDKFVEVVVVTTHIGTISLKQQVKVIELGGGRLFKRLLGILKMLYLVPDIVRSRDESVVLYHMATYPMVLFGPLFKILGVRQIAWYSHSRADLSLRLSKIFIDSFCTPTSNSFPLKINASRVSAVGHCIFPDSLDCATQEDLSESLARKNFEYINIVILGRISPIKRIEIAIDTLAKFPSDIHRGVELVGPIMDKPYLKKLFSMANEAQVNILASGEIRGEVLKKKLIHADVMFNGMSNSIDKSALLGAVNGCFVISDNKDLLDLTGMSAIFHKVAPNKAMTLYDQVETLRHLTRDEEFKFRKELSDSTRVRCNPDVVLTRIMALMEKDGND
jgi:glycosyltransferase involved in cell wall biosynthesis